MSTYCITVSKDRKFFFRTEEQNCHSKYIHNMRLDPVVADIIARFPKSEGYTVDLVIWPDRRGTMIDVTKKSDKSAEELPAVETPEHKGE